MTQNPLMVWKYNNQPPYIWNDDVWERGHDGKLFVANTNINIWIARDGERIKFADYIIIGER